MHTFFVQFNAANHDPASIFQQFSQASPDKDKHFFATLKRFFLPSTPSPLEIDPLKKIQAMPANGDMHAISERIQACLLLGAIGDTLGYGTGHDPVFPGVAWELCGSTENLFRHLRQSHHGNWQRIHFKAEDGHQKWLYSDDTATQLAEARAILKSLDDNSQATPASIADHVAAELCQLIHYEVEGPGRNRRNFGGSTTQTLLALTDHVAQWRHKIIYNPHARGCGAAMRGAVFGLLYPAAANRAQLIALALEASMLSNPSAMGILGGVASAALTAFALEDKPIGHWLPALEAVFAQTKLHLLDIAAHSPIAEQRALAAHMLADDQWQLATVHWREYFADFSAGQAALPPKSQFPHSFQDRDTFHSKYCYKKSADYVTHALGHHGDSAVIFAHHSVMFALRTLVDLLPATVAQSLDVAQLTGSQLRALFDALEPQKQMTVYDALIYYSIFHGGDNDSTGGIALSIFGALLGSKGFPAHLLEEVEGRDEILTHGERLATLCTLKNK